MSETKNYKPEPVTLLRMFIKAYAPLSFAFEEAGSALDELTAQRDEARAERDRLKASQTITFGGVTVDTLHALYRTKLETAEGALEHVQAKLAAAEAERDRLTDLEAKLRGMVDRLTKQRDHYKFATPAAALAVTDVEAAAREVADELLEHMGLKKHGGHANECAAVALRILRKHTRAVDREALAKAIHDQHYIDGSMGGLADAALAHLRLDALAVTDAVKAGEEIRDLIAKDTAENGDACWGSGVWAEIIRRNTRAVDREALAKAIYGGHPPRAVMAWENASEYRREDFRESADACLRHLSLDRAPGLPTREAAARAICEEIHFIGHYDCPNGCDLSNEAADAVLTLLRGAQASTNTGEAVDTSGETEPTLPAGHGGPTGRPEPAASPASPSAPQYMPYDDQHIIDLRKKTGPHAEDYIAQKKRQMAREDADLPMMMKRIGSVAPPVLVKPELGIPVSAPQGQPAATCEHEWKHRRTPIMGGAMLHNESWCTKCGIDMPDEPTEPPPVAEAAPARWTEEQRRAAWDLIQHTPSADARDYAEEDDALCAALARVAPLFAPRSAQAPSEPSVSAIFEDAIRAYREWDADVDDARTSTQAVCDIVRAALARAGVETEEKA